MVLIPKVVAHFETALSAKISAAATTCDLISVSDKAAHSISGYVGVTIDEGTSTEEECLGTLAGNTITFALRGLDPQDPTTAVAALKFQHRRGASVKITDAPVLAIVRLLLNGELSLPSKLIYATDLTFTDDKELIPKKYADALAIAGAPDSSTTVKGLVKMSVAPVSSVAPIAVGDNDPRVPTTAQVAAIPSTAQKAGLASTTTPAASNLYTTQKDFQKGAELYAADAGGTDSYAITLSPVPAAYVVGMIIRFKANTINIGSATLNANSLGSLNILRPDGSALAHGDIAAGQFIEVIIVDASNCRMLSPVANSPKILSGVATRAGNTASGTQNIAHGLGRIPRFIRIKAAKSFGTSTNEVTSMSDGTYDGNTTASVQCNMYPQTGTSGASTSTTNIISITDADGSSQVATVTFDATNIILAWTKSSAPNVADINLLWEAIA